MKECPPWAVATNRSRIIMTFAFTAAPRLSSSKIKNKEFHRQKNLCLNFGLEVAIRNLRKIQELLKQIPRNGLFEVYNIAQRK